MVTSHLPVSLCTWAMPRKSGRPVALGTLSPGETATAGAGPGADTRQLQVSSDWLPRPPLAVFTRPLLALIGNGLATPWARMGKPQGCGDNGTSSN